MLVVYYEENMLISSDDDRKDANCGGADQRFEPKPLARQS